MVFTRTRKIGTAVQGLHNFEIIFQISGARKISRSATQHAFQPGHMSARPFATPKLARNWPYIGGMTSSGRLRTSPQPALRPLSGTQSSEFAG